MRAAEFDVSVELMREAFHMPPMSVVIGASMSQDGRCVHLIVDDPMLPESPEPHAVMPVCHKEAIRWDWNL